MTKTYLLAILLLAIISVNAQQVTVTWGEESKKELDYQSLVNGQGSDMVKLCFETHGGGGFFGKKKTITPILSRYNDKLAEVTTREIGADDNDVNFNTLISIKKKLFMFTSQYDKGDKSTNFYCQSLNITTLNSDGPNVSLGSFDAINKTSQTSVGYFLSNDSSKIMMFGKAPYKKKENEKYYMGVYDQDMKKMWDNTVELPYLDKFVDVLSSVVTNDGKVGVIIKHYDQEVTKESVRGDGSRMPSYKTKFLLYEKGNNKPTEFVLDLKDKFVHAIRLTSDKDNNFVLFGLYKSKYNGYVNGYFVTAIDRITKVVKLSKMEAFPDDLVELVKKDKQASDKESDPGLHTDFQLSTVLGRGDGSTDYLLEYFKLIIRTVYHSTGNGGGYYTTYYEYHYGDIIDINIKQDKAVFTRIPKWQKSTDKVLYSHFKALPYNDKLLLFYNDDRDNVDRDLSKRPDDVVKFGRSILMMAVVDSKGGISRQSILDHKKMDATTCVNECCILDTRRIGLYALRGGGVFSSAKDMVGILEVK
jgi:hypothetical protein